MTSNSYSARVHALIQLGRYQEAASTARQGLASWPDDHVLHGMLAVALSNLGHNREALKHATDAVRLSGSGYDHTLLGQLLSLLGRHKKGLEALRRGVALEPMDAYSHQSLAEGLIRWGGMIGMRGKAVYHEARASAEAAMAIDPVDPASHMVLANVFLQLKDLDSAERYARSGLAIQPNNQIGHELLGLISDRRGDVEAAGEHFIAAAKTNPRSSSPLWRLRNVRGKPVIAVVIAAALLKGLPMSFVPLRTLAQSSRAGWGLIVLIVAIPVGILLVAHWRARRKLGEQAKSVLEADRQLGRRRRWRDLWSALRR